MPDSPLKNAETPFTGSVRPFDNGLLTRRR